MKEMIWVPQCAPLNDILMVIFIVRLLGYHWDDNMDMHWDLGIELQMDFN